MSDFEGFLSFPPGGDTCHTGRGDTGEDRGANAPGGREEGAGSREQGMAGNACIPGDAGGLQLPTPFLPKGTEIVSEELAVHRTEEGWVFYNAGGPFGCCASDDDELEVALLVQFVRPGLLEHRAAAALLGMHRVTLCRTWQRMEAEQAGTRGKVKRGPKGPHEMTEEVVKAAQQVLDHGASMAAAARAVGGDPTTVRLAVRQGTLRLPESRARKQRRRGGGEMAPEWLDGHVRSTTAASTRSRRPSRSVGACVSPRHATRGSTTATGAPCSP